MPDTPSITTIKRFTYKGQPEEWSNTYHFSGAAPTTPAAWKTLADALITIEKVPLLTSVSFVRAYGYAAGNEHSVAQIDYVALGGALVTGSQGAAAGEQMPGDSAAMIRALIGLSSKGKKVYIRKYFHGVMPVNTDPDRVKATQLTAFQTLATALVGGGGPLPGGWCGPQGQAATLPTALPYITTRTLKRRGKRP